MINSRIKGGRTRWLVAVFAVIGLGAATAESAYAAKAVVDITYENGTTLAEVGEPVTVSPYIDFQGVGECEAWDEGSKVGVNHASVAVIDGPGIDEHTSCGGAEGKLVFLAMKISKKGKVSIEVEAAVRATTGCKYNIKKLTGSQPMQTFPSPLGPEGTGTAKLQKERGGPAGCATTVPVSFFFGVLEDGNTLSPLEVGLALA